MVKPTTVSPIVPASTRSGSMRETSGAPAMRPTAMPPTMVTIAAAAAASPSPARSRSRSLPHRVRQNSVPAHTPKTDSASQNRPGSGPRGAWPGSSSGCPCGPSNSSDAAARARARAPARPTTVTSRPGRQPQPSATPSPTASGPSRPIAAPRPCASLIARGAAGPWWSGRNALTPTMIAVPPALATNAPSRVSPSGAEPGVDQDPGGHRRAIPGAGTVRGRCGVRAWTPSEPDDHRRRPPSPSRAGTRPCGCSPASSRSSAMDGPKA